MKRHGHANVSIAHSFILLMTVLLAGCSDEQPLVRPDPYLTPTTERRVLINLQTAYRLRDPVAYAQLLADDFRFYSSSDPLPGNLNRSQDSTLTASLFSLTRIEHIYTYLDFDPRAEALALPGRERWTKISASAVVAAVEPPAAGQSEGLAHVVYRQPELFYFRRGRTADDTLATSPTASNVYLIEWEDQSVAYTSTDSLVTFVTWADLKRLAGTGSPKAHPTGKTETLTPGGN